MKLPAALVLVLAVLCVPAMAQTTHPKPTPEDLRPNNPKVPDAYAISGHFTRIVVMRMKYRTDLLRGTQGELAVRAMHRIARLERHDAAPAVRREPVAQAARGVA